MCQQDLSCNSITDVGAAALAQALRRNRSGAGVDLSHNQLTRWVGAW
jgi:hypothetical protein